MVDMSHIAGLVAGGAHPSPFPYADVVTTTTHKTLRGPRGAIVFVNKELRIGNNRNNASTKEAWKAIDKAVFPGLQGGPHMNQIAAACAALEEAATPSFRRYAHRVVQNARALAEALSDYGWRVISGGTDTHLLLVDTASRDISGGEASTMLERQGIIVNKNMIPYDTRSPKDPSGIRLGTPALTTRGMKEKEMKLVANLINDVLVNNKNVKSHILALCKKFPICNL